MAGTSSPVCREFVETEDFVRSRAELLGASGLTIQQIDDRVEALVWALSRGEVDEDTTDTRA